MHVGRVHEWEFVRVCQACAVQMGARTKWAHARMNGGRIAAEMPVLCMTRSSGCYANTFIPAQSGKYANFHAERTSIRRYSRAARTITTADAYKQHVQHMRTRRVRRRRVRNTYVRPQRAVRTCCFVASQQKESCLTRLTVGNKN